MFLLISYMLTPNINATFKIIYKFGSSAPWAGHPQAGVVLVPKGAAGNAEDRRAAVLVPSEQVLQGGDSAGPITSGP